ncbi:hypothetical protein ACFSB1_00950 [Halopseudomonas phragmitis]|uniref:Uncharacterized protein n=1 Tax=Halopseudomonas phragmitis TaxID=1931241 RepID=A0A1V0B6J3_9GAMM|nr:hypothetical protein [Halopseudomonas phragmitis]AQZ95545.1 hypothetical protein BVH74_12645 [Halopseudomonas phragmitis]PAU86315.1 hypothetical protein CK507_15850 [Pseudomonas sp. WN033]
MKPIKGAAFWFAMALALPAVVEAADYTITGSSGIMNFVAVNPSKIDDEDVYRLAVADACAGKPICQVHYWAGSAPSGLPLTDEQVDEKLAAWQLNLNTGLRRWLVKCAKSDIFANNRECM